MNIESNEPLTPLPAIRHDGWTGEAMAKFLETLAETRIVLEACEAASKSSTAAYAVRRRAPLFAEALETPFQESRAGINFINFPSGEILSRGIADWPRAGLHQCEHCEHSA